MTMELKWEETDSSPYLKVKGEIDVFNVLEFSKTVLSAIENNSENLKIDLSELTYISSAGLRVFVIAGKDLAAKKRRIVIKLPNDPKVEEIFYLSGLYTIFDIQKVDSFKK